jgi:LTXXQ motif family protein
LSLHQVQSREAFMFRRLVVAFAAMLAIAASSLVIQGSAQARGGGGGGGGGAHATASHSGGDTAEQRLDAMLDAVSSVRGPLMKFYDSLGDQQKARLDAMGLSPGREAGAGGGEAQAGVVPRICSERNNAVAQLSIEDIEKNVHPTDAQRQNLEDLRNASVRAADAIKASCPSKTQLTVTARIEAVEGRLGAMLDAVKTVRGPLEKFYDSLSDEQRARFNRMGPPSRRTG